MISNRRILCLLAAIALALSAGAMGCDTDAEGGEGGAGGGSSGQGGSGGTGGEGIGPCEGYPLLCRVGEKCVAIDTGAICTCDPSNDMCSEGNHCDPDTLRCEPTVDPCEGNPLSCRIGEKCVDYGGELTCMCEPSDDQCSEGNHCDPQTLRCEPIDDPGTGGTGS